MTVPRILVVGEFLTPASPMVKRQSDPLPSSSENLRWREQQLTGKY